MLGLTLSSIAACGADNQSSPVPPPIGLGHIHGIGENPSDKTVYLATHTGVYRLKSGSPQLIANRHQDTMGFTIAGPDEFLASGHPALDSTDPNPLGLIRSTDLAESWTPIAFAGEQDFHSIDVAPGRTYAYGSSGDLLVMQDKKTWKKVAQAELIDIAADPTAPGKVFATTTKGKLVAFRENGNGAPSNAFPDAPPLALIDVTPQGMIVGVDPSGQIFSGDNEGTNWEKLAVVSDVPEAISVRNKTWYTATENGVYASSDEGRSWQRLLKIQM
ncbi:MAG: F510_1955 family glycosylhydrolase [Aeromicrobium sp.]